MDDGPFRMPRSADRSATNRPEPQEQPKPEEPQPVIEEPKPVHRAPVSHHTVKEEKPFNRFILPIAAAIIVLVVLIIGWVVIAGQKKTDTGIDTSKYQAVFFVNDNVYFGKLQDYSDTYYKMTNIYYPQSQSTDGSESTAKQQTTAANQSNITLLKLSDAIHGPEDSMMIAKDQVLFYQNLKSDSKVAKLIDGQKK